MGTNIPRPTKRPPTPNIDGMYGFITANEVRKRYLLDPVEEVKQQEISKPIEKSFFNCPNCCAPVVKEYCEYCGTRFGFIFKKVEQTPIREDPFKQFQETAYNFGVGAPKLPLKVQR